MALEASTLSVVVKGDGIASTTEALNKLAAAGDKVEKSSAKLSQSNKGAEASLKQQEKVWYDLLAKASAYREKEFNVHQRALDKQNKLTENAILKEAYSMNAAFDKAVNATKIQQEKLDEINYSASQKAAAKLKAQNEQLDLLRREATAKQLAQAQDEANKLNKAFDRRIADEKASYEKLQREADKYVAQQEKAAQASYNKLAAQAEKYQNQKIKDAERALAAETAAIAKAEAVRTAAAEREALLNARFNTASSSSRLSLVQQAAAYGATGGNVASQYGSSVAALANSQGVQQLTADHKRLTEEANKSREALRGGNAEMENAHALARGLSGSLGALWLTYGNILPLIAGAAIGASIKEAVSGFADVQYQLTFMKALTEDTTNSVASLAKQMHEVAAELGINPEAASKGLRALAQAGLDTQQALKVLPDAFKLAAVGELPLESAALAGVSVLNAYGVSLQRQGESFEHVGDVMAKAGAMSAASVASMTESFKYSAGTAEQYGVSLEKLATVITLLGKRSITGSSAGVATNNLIAEIYSPSSQKAIQAQAALGVKAYANGARQSLEEVIESIKQGLKKYDSESQGILLEAMFGKKGGKAFYAVAMQNKEAFLAMEDELVKSSGFTANVYRQSLETITGQLALTKSAITNMFSTIGEESDGPIKALLSTVRGFANDPVVKDAFVGLAQSIKTFLTVIVPVAGVLGSVWASLKIGTASVSLITTAFARLAAVNLVNFFAEALASLTLFVEGVATMNVALLASNPIFLGLTGVVAALGVAYLVFHKNKETALSLHETEMQNSKEVQDSLKKEIELLDKKLRLAKQGVGLEDEAAGLRKLTVEDDVSRLQAEITSIAEKAKKLGGEDALTTQRLPGPVQRKVDSYKSEIDARKEAIEDKKKSYALEEALEKRRKDYLEEIRKVREKKDQDDKDKNPSEVGTQKFDPKAEKDANKKIKFYEQERTELEKLRDGYKARTESLIASGDAEVRVMAAIQQARVKVNIQEGKYASDSDARANLALAVQVDRAKFEKDNADAIVEQKNKITEILNREAAFQAQASKQTGVAIGLTEQNTAAILKYNHASQETLDTEAKRARQADEILRIEAARVKLTSATANFKQQADQLNAESESMEELGSKTKNTALEQANALIAKSKLTSAGDAIVKVNLLEAASLKDLAEGYNGLVKQSFDLEKQLKQAQAEGVAVFADSEAAKIKIASDAAKKRAEVDYQQVKKAADKEAESGGLSDETIAKLTTSYNKYQDNLAVIDKISAQEMDNVRTKDWKKTVDDIERIAREGFFNMSSTGKSIWASMANTFKSMFKTTVMEYIYKEFAKPLVLKVVASLAGTLGFDGLASAASKMAGGTGGESASLVDVATKTFKMFSDGLNKVSDKIADGISTGLSKLGVSESTAGTIGGYAGNLATGYAVGSTLNKAISGKYETGSGFMKAENVATAIASAINPVLGSVVGAVSGLVNRAFGMGPKELTATGIRGTISDSGVSGQSYSNYHQDGGWFRSDKNTSDVKALGNDVVNSFSSALTSLKVSSTDFAKTLNVSSNALDGYSKSFDILLTPLKEVKGSASDQAAIKAENEQIAQQNNQKITDFFTKIGDDLATKLIPNISDFAKAGESASTTLERLSTTFQVTNDLATQLGTTGEKAFGSIGLSSEKLRTKLVDLSGGTDALSSKTSAYVNAIYTDSQKLAPVQKAVTEAMSSLGLAGITTVDQFKSVVEGLDLTNEANVTLLNSLLNLAPAFAEVANAAKELADKVLEKQIALLELQGRKSEALALSRKKELDAMSDSEKAIQKQIYTLQDALDGSDLAFDRLTKSVNAQKDAVEQAAEAAKNAVEKEKDAAKDRQDIVKSLLDNIKSALKAGGSDSLEVTPARRAEAQALLATAAISARAGGDVTKTVGLEQALDVVSKTDKDVYKTYQDYVRDVTKTNNTLVDLRDATQKQYDYAQLTIDKLDDTIDAIDEQKKVDIAYYDRMLETAQVQVDALKGIDSSVLNLNSALDNFQSAITNAVATKTQQVTGNNSKTVEALYKGLLNRDSDKAGLEYWTKALDSGNPVSAITEAIKSSSEYQANFLQSVYKSTFNRDVDSEGLAYWQKVLSSGASFNDVEDAIKGSKEAQGKPLYTPATDNLQTATQQKASADVSNADVVSILKEVKEVIMAGDLANVQSSNDLKRIIKRWDQDGTPSNRDVAVEA